jgi:hypothetical protein
LVNVRFFSFRSGQRVQKAEIGHKKKRTTSFVPLFVPLFACRHFSYIFTVRFYAKTKLAVKARFSFGFAVLLHLEFGAQKKDSFFQDGFLFFAKFVVRTFGTSTYTDRPCTPPIPYSNSHEGS